MKAVEKHFATREILRNTLPTCERMCDNQILLKRGDTLSKLVCEAPDTLLVLKDGLVLKLLLPIDNNHDYLLITFITKC